MIKRVFDLVSSLIGLILLAPVMAVIAVLVKRDSKGPALFKQERVGRGGKPFTLLKFRSMTVTPALSGPLLTTAADARITRVGAKLRATKLDELPQLINVLRGEMSLVGPRPEVPQYVDMWPAELRGRILSVRPGITDPATLSLRQEERILARQPDPERYYQDVLLPRKAEAYAHYAAARTLRGDVALAIRTLLAIAKAEPMGNDEFHQAPGGGDKSSSPMRSA